MPSKHTEFPNQPPGPPYKSENGRWLSGTLFYETWILSIQENRYCDPIFTTGHDRPGLISARKTFVELGDPSGYEWALMYLGDWAHFTYLLKSSWFQKALEIWREELDTKLKSEAMRTIRAIALEQTPTGLAAAKFLATEDYKKRSGAGRPSKELIKGKLADAARILTQEDEDAERIGLTIINGGKSG